MAAQSAYYRFRYGQSAPLSDYRDTTTIAERSTDGYVWGSMDFARDLVDFAPRLDVGHVSPECRQLSLSVLADALSGDAGARDAAGDARAKAGRDRFLEHYIARQSRGSNAVVVKRATILDVCARLGI